MSQRTVSKHVCFNCHNCFDREITYLKHIDFCHRNESQHIQMPQKGAKRRFENRIKGCGTAFKTAFMMIWDFEALQVQPERSCGCPPDVLRNTEAAMKAKKMKMDMNPSELTLLEEEEKTLLEAQLRKEAEVYRRQHPELGDKDPPRRLLPSGRKRKFKICQHKTHVVREQPPFMFSYVVVDRDGNVVQMEKKHDTSGDVVGRFVNTVLDVAEKFLPSLSPGAPMNPLTAEEMMMMHEATRCYLCNRPFVDGLGKVRDHDHLNGSFLGAAHNHCNLRRRETARLTCFAHNFSG